MAQSQRHRHRGRVREAAASRYSPSPPGEGVTGVLLDSDVIIEILRGRATVARALRATEALGIATYCCAIASAEVGADLRPGEETVAEAFFQARGEVVIDTEIGRRAGAYLSRYARSHGVEIADALVAAAASTAGLSLWALNRKHYPMDDLRLYDPPLSTAE
jgi:predicted nucleic acid-binding protein